MQVVFILETPCTNPTKDQFSQYKRGDRLLIHIRLNTVQDKWNQNAIFGIRSDIMILFIINENIEIITFMTSKNLTFPS